MLRKARICCAECGRVARNASTLRMVRACCVRCGRGACGAGAASRAGQACCAWYTRMSRTMQICYVWPQAPHAQRGCVVHGASTLCKMQALRAATVCEARNHGIARHVRISIMHLQLVRMLHTPTQREWITHVQAALIFPCRSQRLRRRQRPQGLRLCQRSQGTPHLEQPQSAPRRRRSQSAARLRLPPGAPYCERPQGLIRHQRSKSLPCRH